MHNAVFDCDKTNIYFKTELMQSLHTDTMILAHILDENGWKEYPGKIDLTNSWVNPQGKMINKAIEKECPGCGSVYFEIDSEGKKVNIGYFDKDLNFLKASTY
jgi:hypothetical protein